jgi:hypothetical protein
VNWASIKATGNGRMRYAVVIEGWPEIWVTDHSLTLTNGTFGARGRSVRVGLIRKGLRVHERAQLQQGRLEAGPMTFRFISGDHGKQAVHSFASVGQVAGVLADDLAAADTSMTLYSADGVITGGYFHVGTEVVNVEAPEGPGASAVNITRAHWDTQAQSFLQTSEQDLLTHKVYTRPTSARGRRITLYVWGDGNDSTGYSVDGEDADYGQPLWRGIISLPPRCNPGAAEWMITADHISTIFRQQLCARNEDVHVVGLWHSSSSPLYVGAFDASGPVIRRAHIQWSPDRRQFTDDTRAILEEIRVDAGLDAYFAEGSMYIEWYPDRGIWAVFATTVASPASFHHGVILMIKSHICGSVTANVWRRVDDNERTSTLDGDDNTFPANTRHYVELTPQTWSTTVIPADVAAGVTSGPYYDVPAADSWEFRIGATTVADDDQVQEYSGNRLYIDKDWSETGANALMLDIATLEHAVSMGGRRPTEGSLQLAVTDSGIDTTTWGSASNTAAWVRIDPPGRGDTFYGWAHADSVFRPTYATSEPTDVVGFIQQVIDDATAHSNDAAVPFVRDTDFNLDTEIHSIDPDIIEKRSYAFVKPVAMEDVIAEELKLGAHMWSVSTTDAKPTFRRIPVLTGTISATRVDGEELTIAAGDIQTPAGGDGAFPSYEIQAQGLVSMVKILTGYDPSEDDHIGPSRTVVDADSISTQKLRGTTEMTIAPKSTSLTEIDQAKAIDIAEILLAVLGREYVTTKVPVPFTHFDVQLGDVVVFTSAHVPNTSGTMGVTNKKALVIGRSWNLDPGDNEHGELELLFLLTELYGYTPSGMITGATGSHPDWVLTLGPFIAGTGDDINMLLSPRGDGDIASSFAVGDQIRVIEFGVGAGGVSRSGVVTAVGATTVSVTLDHLWTIGSSGWTLEYDEADQATDSQKLYCFVAGEDGLIDGSEIVRLFG